jgi:5-methylcytosine-specific restriction endonuclease McrA
MTSPRGTTNGNRRGNSEDRRRRREWLVETYRANVDLTWDWFGSQRFDWLPVEVSCGAGEPACRCYRCGCLLTVDTVTADRIIPGAEGGTYRRNNLRPACGPCNSETGGALGATRRLNPPNRKRSA